MSIIQGDFFLKLDNNMDKLYIALIIFGIGVILYDKIPGLAGLFKSEAKKLDLKSVKVLEPTLAKEIEKNTQFIKNAAIVKDLYDTVGNPQIKNYLRTTVLPELLKDKDNGGSE